MTSVEIGLLAHKIFYEIYGREFNQPMHSEFRAIRSTICYMEGDRESIRPFPSPPPYP